eukprot:Rmarinus@m.157
MSIERSNAGARRYSIRGTALATSTYYPMTCCLSYFLIYRRLTCRDPLARYVFAGKALQAMSSCGAHSLRTRTTRPPTRSVQRRNFSLASGLFPMPCVLTCSAASWGRLRGFLIS